MTKETLKDILSGAGGQFVFSTDQHEGMIGITPASVVIWVDKIGYNNAEAEDEAEPQNAGKFKNVDELLEAFKVDSVLFSEKILPQVETLNRILT